MKSLVFKKRVALGAVFFLVTASVTIVALNRCGNSKTPDDGRMMGGSIFAMELGKISTSAVAMNSIKLEPKKLWARILDAGLLHWFSVENAEATSAFSACEVYYNAVPCTAGQIDANFAGCLVTAGGTITGYFTSTFNPTSDCVNPHFGEPHAGTSFTVRTINPAAPTDTTQTFKYQSANGLTSSKPDYVQSLVFSSEDFAATGTTAPTPPGIVATCGSAGCGDATTPSSLALNYAHATFNVYANSTSSAFDLVLTTPSAAPLMYTGDGPTMAWGAGGTIDVKDLGSGCTGVVTISTALAAPVSPCCQPNSGVLTTTYDEANDSCGVNAGKSSTLTFESACSTTLVDTAGNSTTIGTVVPCIF